MSIELLVALPGTDHLVTGLEGQHVNDCTITGYWITCSLENAREHALDEARQDGTLGYIDSEGFIHAAPAAG